LRRRGVAAAVLAEAAHGYDLVVVGASDGRHGGLFGPVADAVVRSAPCAVFVLRAPDWRGGDIPLRRILLPTTGTRADLRGAEFALTLARGAGAAVVALHVVESHPLGSPFGGAAAADLRGATEIGWHATRAVAQLGASLGVPVTPEVRLGAGLTAADEIVHLARDTACDLILLAGEPRPADGELYCGRTLSQVVRAARGPVAVLFEGTGRSAAEGAAGA